MNLKDKEKQKLDTIKKILIGECSKEEALKTLNLTIRQINC